jgi:hypothetical protein
MREGRFWLSQDFILCLAAVRLRRFMRALDTLKQLAEQKAPGPNPSFTELHLAKAIEIISEERMGRSGLSERLGLGEGTTRTLIDRLLEARLVKISKRGCELTGSGLSILKELSSKLGPKASVARSPITVGPYDFGILVRKAGNKVTSGIDQRDAAVRAGGNGAVTLVFRHGHLQMPSADDSKIKVPPHVAGEVIENFRPQENDVLVIAGGSSERVAEDSAMAAAWTLLRL